MVKKRFEIIDHFKAFAVILMVFYHFAYDLYVLKVISFNMAKNMFWYSLPKIIVSTFLFSAGINLCIVNSKGINKEKIYKRFFKLFFISIIISVASYFFAPNKWISFGVIHHITLASIVGLLFLKKPKTSLILGIIILFPSVFFNYDYPLPKPVKYPLDHVAFLPWFGCFLIGIYAYSREIQNIQVPKYKGKNFISFLGKNSLEIYLTHQFILYPSIYLVKKYLM